MLTISRKGLQSSPNAGFPETGLSALYKCDEKVGDKLYEAENRLGPMTLSTGVGLDNTGGTCYVTDTTSMAGVLNGESAMAVCGAEFITPPASTLPGTTTEYRILSRNTSATVPVSFYLREITTSRTYRIYLEATTSLDGGGAATITFQTGTDIRLSPETHYQCVARLDTSASTPFVVFSYREGASGPWTNVKIESGTAGSHVFTSTGTYRLLQYYTGAGAFDGTIMSAFLAVGDVPITSVQKVLERPTRTNIMNILGSDSRFWLFNAGTGSIVRELVTNTTETINGTPAWSTSLSGCTQQALGQGNGYYGRAGVKLGGEASFGALGGGAEGPAGTPSIVASSDGWTVQATFKVGDHAPSTEQLVASFCGPNIAGDEPSTLAISALPGVHFSVTTNSEVYARIGALNRTSGVDTSGAVIGISDGTRLTANGLLTTYTITCDSSGVATMYRQANGETTVTEVGELDTDVQNIFTIADRACVGRASMDADVTVGFLAAWSRVLTEDEMNSCHRMAVSKMDRQDLYSHEALGISGNGSENAPYSTIQSALKITQPSQTIYVGPGDYGRITTLGDTLGPSSSDGVTLIGSGTITLTGDHGENSDHPAYIGEGTWSFSGFIFDAEDLDFYAVQVTNEVDSVSFTNCEFNNAFQDDVETATGTGLSSQAAYNYVADCTCTDNDEHGVYFRRLGGEYGDGQFIVNNLTVTGSGEDGLKVTNEAGEGTRWVNCTVNNLIVDGGKNQLYLLGVQDSVFTNILLTNPDTTGALVASALLGNVQAFTGETLDSDYPLYNVTIANMTIVGGGNAFRLRGDTGSLKIYNVVCSGCDDDWVDETTGMEVTASNCAGDDDSSPFPDENNNIPEATITFVNAPDDYSLAPSSDGYGDGRNLYSLNTYIQTDLGGTPRSGSGAWNMGAY